jgi:hypothetical protein
MMLPIWFMATLKAVLSMAAAIGSPASVGGVSRCRSFPSAVMTLIIGLTPRVTGRSGSVACRCSTIARAVCTP